MELYSDDLNYIENGVLVQLVMSKPETKVVTTKTIVEDGKDDGRSN